MKRPYILITILIIIIFGLTLVRTVVANRITTNGVMLGEIEDKISFYKTENLIFKEKIYTLSSLTNISTKAQKIGFVGSTDGIALTGALPIAQRQ